MPVTGSQIDITEFSTRETALPAALTLEADPLAEETPRPE